MKIVLVKPPFAHRAPMALAVLLLPLNALLAQQSTEKNTPAPNGDEPVVLTPFEVKADQSGDRYRSSAATSGGRVAIDLADSVQSVAVVTRDLIDDSSALRILDATAYAVSGVTESTIPNGLDRTTIRGFQTDGQTVDGFYSITQMNLDPVFIDRIEVVKGPNAVLSPAGVPGGTINNVTRRPKFKDFGSVSAEFGLFDSQRLEMDYNHVLVPKTLAFRVVGAAQDTEGYYHDRKRTVAVMPMITYRSPSGTELTLQTSLVNWRIENYLGLPIDPSSGTNGTAKLIAGVNRRLNTSDDDFRVEKRYEIRGLLTAPISPLLSLRLAGRFTNFDADFEQALPGGATGGSRDPLTGAYVGGINFSSVAPYTGTPIPLPRVFARGGTWQTNHRIYANIQNDYAFQWENELLDAKTLMGGAFNYFRQASRDIVTSKAAINFDAPAPANYVTGALSNRQDTINYDIQAYATQSLGFFGDRAILSGGYSSNSYDLAVDDLRLSTKSRVSVAIGLVSYGLVVKPLPGFSLYYGFSENAQPQAATTIAAGNPPLTNGKQKEFGLRYESPDKRYSASVAHFDIKQDNFAVPNPGNLAVPPPVPPLPFLLSNRKAKGWEYEARANITKDFAVIGNYTNYTNRDPNNVPFRGNAEQSWALSGDYQFDRSGPLHGLSVWLGVDYLAKRPGDSATGVTAASTPTHIIPNQPSFYLPARTLVNLGLSYRLDAHWRTQLSVANLLDEKYLAASLSRFSVFPGTPPDIRLRVTFDF